jgi:microcystin-dependent protein
MSLSHTFSCTVADGTNTAVVRPSDWNAGHVIAAGTSDYGLVPVGGLAVWAGLVASPPTGWFVCDGSEKSTATYAGLYAVVGTMYGSGSGTFKLPDLRDKFVVGANQDSSGVPKSNIRGSLEQSIAVTGITLTHNGSVSDHTGLTHTGVAVGDHPALSHAAIGIADHAAIASSALTLSIAPQATISNAATSAAANTIGVTASAHAWTGPSIPALTHTASTGAGGTAGWSHASVAHTGIAQPDAHGTAGTVTHSFTAPTQHTSSIVPSFLAMAYIIRYE